MNRSEQIGDLIAALAKAQAEFTPAFKESEAIVKGTSKKTGANYEYKYNYADLAANISAVRPALNKHGIALMQFDDTDLQHQTASVTTALHYGEQWISQTAQAPASGIAGFDLDSISSCWTKLRRYTLQALCGLASEDDDARVLAGANDHPIQKTASQVQDEARQRAKEMEQPAVDQGPFKLTGDILECVVRSVVQKETSGDKQRPFSLVMWNGALQGFNFGTCFDTAQEEAFQVGVGKVCHLKIKPWKEGDKFLRIEAVAAIDGAVYERGKPTGESVP